MAWPYGLDAECGTAEDRARELARHVQTWNSGPYQRGEHWWCGAHPDGLSRSGINSDAEAAAMTAAGQQLYAALRTAPPVYRYALVGVDTEEFWTYAELTDDSGSLPRLPGLVLSDEIWAVTGRLSVFTPFSPGYRWHPYDGERYQPSR
jgi:hypothetical protein